MTDAEISRRLALAIGWSEKEDDPDVIRMGTLHDPEIHTYVWHSKEWVLFDYRDPAVIWPIAERFKCFPDWFSALDDDAEDEWSAWDDTHECFVYADTAAKAVALAVIKSKEQT